MSPVQTYLSVWLAISAVALIFRYLYLLNAYPFLRSWVLGWILFSARLLMLLISSILSESRILPVMADICEIFSAVAFLDGALLFIGRPRSRYLLGASAIYCLGFAAAAWLGAGPGLRAVLSHCPPGAMLIAAGIAFSRNRKLPRAGRITVVICLIIWGLHKFDYPILNRSPTWSLWGFWITAIIAILTGLGMILLYYEYTRRELAESEEKYRRLVETTNTGYVILDAAGRVLDANAEYLRLTGRRELQDILGRSVIEWTAEKDRARNAIEVQRCLDTGMARNLEVDYVDLAGRPTPIEINATLVTSGATPVIVTLCRDIGARKRTEDSLRRAVGEKETLLRELYHRTKNNMSVIISLLNLQANESKDPAIKRGFEEARNRINAMALVHEKLYDTEDLSRIRLGDYVRDLAAYLVQSYGLGASIALDLKDMDDPPVTIDSAIPCALILNELISNSIKYAFPGGRKGSISLSVKELEDGLIEIRVADDGVGFPAGFDYRRDGGMGLQTILALAEGQLLGSLSFESGTGLTCTFRFAASLEA
jgi:PAS domain S-box-containing protein